CSTPTINQTVNVVIKVKNQGASSANGTFWVDFYKNLSQAPALVQVGDVYWSQSSLGAGATAQFTTSFLYEGGQYNLYAQIDSDNDITESSESNNVYGPVSVKEEIAAGWIRGRVISKADGKAVQGAAVAAKQGAATINSAATNIAGDYVLAVASGAYTLEVTASGFFSSSTAVSILPEQTKYKDFSLSPATGKGVISGLVTKADGVTPIPNATIKLGSAVVEITLANAIGAYRFIASTGTYNLEASAVGYVTKVTSNVAVLDNQATSVNFALALANTPPEPVSDLAAMPLDNLKVFLSWTPSVSNDVSYYRIYYAAGTLDYQTLYASIKDTLSHPGRSWTSPALNRSQSYYFSVRPVNTLGVENLDTNNIVSAAISESVSGVKAAIKVPQTGKKVSGNRLTIVAEAVQEPLNVTKVKFMYKASHLEDWESVPAADARHPNPDTTWPYFLHWDLKDSLGNALTDGNYDLRAMAYDKSNNPDPAPLSITISLNSVDKDVEETIAGGIHLKKERVRNEKENVVSAGGFEDDSLTEVRIATGALNQAADYVNIKIDPSLSSQPIGSLAKVVKARDISLESGQKTLNQDAQITIPYQDANSDGIVDGTSLKEDDLQVWYYNDSAGIWKKEDNVTIDKTNNQAITNVRHFSTFALVSPAGTSLADVKVFPSPVKTHQGHDRATFAGLTGNNVTIKIFNVAGELVFEKENIASAAYDWMLANESGKAVAGGIYIYLVTDASGGKAAGKFGLIR
ncbi:MAG: carboxypeptidase regulatory-like domain-containing protein, partial [Elusimicrobia bacterium]|nr:carboxypeptidase regulatory-like domain-containing protein [Elusimicrobiota bacterium]